MMSRSVGTVWLSRRWKLCGIGMSHWSSRICCTTAFSARSASTNVSVSVMPTPFDDHRNIVIDSEVVRVRPLAQLVPAVAERHRR